MLSIPRNVPLLLALGCALHSPDGAWAADPASTQVVANGTRGIPGNAAVSTSAPSSVATSSRSSPGLQTYSVSHLIPFPSQAVLAVTQDPVPSAGPAGATPPPAPPQTRRRDPRQLKIGGLLLGIGYAPALALALALSPQAGQPGSPTLAANYTLLIPVVGPLVSGALAPAQAASGTVYGAVTTWTLPLVLTLGLLQATGFGLLTSGAVPKLRSSDSSHDSLNANFPPWKTQ